jgi:hypothetical protein
MRNEILQLIQSKSPGSVPLYLVIRGSHAYGTNLSTSDTDYSGVFVQDIDSILGMSYIEQINDDKNDIVIYEIRRFLELLAKNNPTILELLNTPQDCIIYKHFLFDKILENKDIFLTKMCANSFGGYAKEQISKAKGQNKKQNWEKNKVKRKTPLDFCYIHKGEHSLPIIEYLQEFDIKQEYCGLSKIPHSKDTYGLFYSDEIGKFNGIAFEDSNDIRLSSIPIDLPESCFLGHMSYNKDAYMTHCRDYKSYETWVLNRNEQRWVDVESHGQKIDGKNMMHCRRLMDMAREIAEGSGIIVRRPNAQELIDIRQGKVDLQSLIDHVENEIKQVDILFEKSTLPDKVDMNFVNQILINIRKGIYNL